MPGPILALPILPKAVKVAAAKLAPKLVAKPAGAKVAGAIASRTARKESIALHAPAIGARAVRRIADRQAVGMARGMARMPKAASRYVAKTLTARGLVTAGLAGGALYVAKRGVDTQRLKVETLRASEEFRLAQLRRYAETRDPAHLRLAEETRRGMEEIARTPDLPGLPVPKLPPVEILVIGAVALLGLLLYLRRR